MAETVAELYRDGHLEHGRVLVLAQSVPQRGLAPSEPGRDTGRAFPAGAVWRAT